MNQPTTPPLACEACDEPITPAAALGRFHTACIERLLARQRRVHTKENAR